MDINQTVSLLEVLECRSGIYHCTASHLICLLHARKPDHEYLYAGLVEGEVNQRSCLHLFSYWWRSFSTFNRPFSFYQSLYAGLGISQAVFTFILYVSSQLLCLLAYQYSYSAESQWIRYLGLFLGIFTTKRFAISLMLLCPSLIQQWVASVLLDQRCWLRSCEPVGRIMGIFGKDIDCKQSCSWEEIRFLTKFLAIDNQLPSRFFSTCWLSWSSNSICRLVSMRLCQYLILHCLRFA